MKRGSEVRHGGEGECMRQQWQWRIRDANAREAKQEARMNRQKMGDKDGRRRTDGSGHLADVLSKRLMRTRLAAGRNAKHFGEVTEGKRRADH